MEIKFKRKIVKNGASLQSSYPPELIEFLGLEEGDTVFMTSEIKSKGKFIAIWKE